MSKKIAQAIIAKNDLSEGPVNVFEDVTVTVLGIQAPPGTEFSINNDSEMEMGLFGIYELDLENLGGIVSSLTIVAIPEDASENTRVIVDYVYESVGV